MNINKLIKELENRRKQLAKQRDMLRRVIEEYDELDNDVTSAMEDIDSAIETLSRQV